jgi:peptidoglycan/xylan/chitin deacetylase (PgdA/CDA1 family)
MSKATIESKRKILHILRDIFFSFSYYAGITTLFNQMSGRKSGIISYHNILPEEKLLPYDVYRVDTSLSVFERQLIYLKSTFPLLPIDSKDPATGFHISFDDGMLNNYTLALPLLKKYEIKAMFAICPALVNKEIPFLWRDHFFLLLKNFIGKSLLLPFDQFQKPFLITEDNLQMYNTRFKKLIYEQKIADPYLLLKETCNKNSTTYSAESLQADSIRFESVSWEQVQEMHSEGHLIASHTMSHKILKFLSSEEKLYELKQSKEEIEDRIKAKTEHIVYPYGGYEEVDIETVKLAEKVGYKWGYLNIEKDIYQLSPLAKTRFALPPVANMPHIYSVVTGYKKIFK